MRDFEKIMRDTNRWVDDHFNKTERIYKFSNGSFIEFFPAVDLGRVRGPRRDVLYINECNRVTFDTYYQMAIRTSGNIWLDFNPDNAFWVHEELREDPDAEWLTLTFMDNEALDENIRNELLKAKERGKTSSYWDNWWKVYGLGQLGKLEGVIFDNWTTVPDIPREASLIGYAIDFGFTNDPTTIVAAWRWNESVIWQELCYQTQMTNKDIAMKLRALGARSTDFIVADSAEPKSIKEINEYGYRLKGAVKGRDSVNFGIGVLQEEPFLVTEDSTNMIKELRLYAWDTDRSGASLNKPIAKYDHCFTGDTLIETGTGPRRIDSINPGDQVITSAGGREVLKWFNNGRKEVFVYQIKVEDFEVTLKCTSTHKIKTFTGWKLISQIQKGDTIFLSSNLTGASGKYVQSRRVKGVIVTDSFETDVYDLMVDSEHEYIANGVLVHNCIDGMRYLATARFSRQKKKRKGPRRRN